jgi:hypothetical protein
MNNENVGTPTEIEIIEKEIKLGKKFILSSLRSIKYDLETALSEFVDNSIDSGASEIRIHHDGKKKISISDDGSGMSMERLRESMNIGSDRIYKEDEIGFFGIGMKAAMCYLGSHIKLKTKRKGDDYFSVMEWDINKSPLTLKFSTKHTEKGIDTSGTSIDIIVGDRYGCYETTNVTIFRKFCIRYYHTLSKESNNPVKILINGTNIIGFDPMYRSNKDTLITKPEDIVYKNSVIHISGYYLKNIIEMSEKGIPSKQGIYIYYNNKYINLGGTYLGADELHPTTNYLRIELRIPKYLTEHLGLSMNKNSVSDFLDESETDELKSIIRKNIKEIILWARNEDIKNRNSKKSEINPEDKKKHETLINKINDDIKKDGFSKNPLLDPEVSKLVPVNINIKKENENENKIETGSTKNRPSNLSYNRNVFDVSHFDGNEKDSLWNIRRNNNQLVMDLNINHIFYKTFIEPYDDNEKSKMYKLLYCMAFSQLETYSTYSFDGKILDLWDQYWFDSSRAITQILK